MNSVTNTTVMRLRINPVFPIWVMLILPLEKTIALGGVPMGSIKAHDAAMVAGSINNRGFTWSAWEVAARMGSIMVVEAVLDVTSVRKVMVNATAAIIKITGTC